MSPDQYKDFCARVAAKKERKRAQLGGLDPADHTDWEARVQQAQTIRNPNLPPLDSSVPLPVYTEAERELYSLPEDLLDKLAAESGDV